MTNIRFLLNKGKIIKDKNKPQPIYLRYKKGSKVDFYASLKCKILYDDWDQKKQRVKNRIHILDGQSINDLIEGLSTHFHEFDKNLRSEGIIPNYQMVKKYYDGYSKEPEPPKIKESLFSYIDDFINKPETQRNLTSGTIKSYKLTRTFLLRFNDEVRPIDFDDINLEFHNDFIEWCNDQNLSENYIGKHIKILKTFMTNAVDDGKTSNLSFKHKKFKVLREDVENIYLSLDELQKIWKLDLSKQPRHDNARNLFLIGAYTGLRVSDFNHLSDRDITTINGKRMIRVKTQKTNKPVAIPLHPIVEDILKKNDGIPPARMPEQTINKLIKEVAEFAGIDETIHISKTKGGNTIILKKCKFELVMTHTARRSFCTNAYLSEVPTMDIMSISGHTSEKMFLNYIKVTPEQRAAKMSEHPFFKNNQSLKAV